ncbi:MAG: hypothetical protein U0744_20405 [Gemmataceae bacterium]
MTMLVIPEGRSENSTHVSGGLLAQLADRQLSPRVPQFLDQAKVVQHDGTVRHVAETAITPAVVTDQGGLPTKGTTPAAGNHVRVRSVWSA